MTKEYFLQLADYNIWANNKVCSWIEKINDGQWKQDIVSSFTSIEATVLHVAASEKVWFERLSRQPFTYNLTNSFKGSKPELVSIWKEMSANLKPLIETFDDNGLKEKLVFKNILGVEHNLPFYELFAHVFNHSTFHRGQLVTMFRQVGFTELSSTDITTFFRIQADEKKLEGAANAQ